LKLEAIAGNIAHAIKDRSSDAPYTLVVEFTDKESKWKSATGCVLIQMSDQQHYKITSNDFRYMDAGQAILDEELGAFFECDDDLDQRQVLIDRVTELIEQDDHNDAQPIN